MNNQVINFVLASFSLESVLQFIRSPQNAQIYNAIVVALLAVIGLILCWACVSITKRITEKDIPNPRKLFLQLCRAHELSASERRQLELLASLNRLETPAILMIDASIWNVDQLTNEKKLQPKQRERLLTLQKMLYEQPRLSTPLLQK